MSDQAPPGVPAASGALLHRLPHTGSARLPTRVIGLDPGRRVVTAREIAAGDPLLNPEGALPSALLVELMAQTGGLLLEEDLGAGGLLAGVSRMHLHGTARAGDTVTATCTLVRRLGDVLLVQCEAALEGRQVLAHGRIHIRRLTGTSR